MKRDKRARPRWVQAVWAFLGGYFWLPCPVCKEYFGGHEIIGLVVGGKNSGLAVCINCIDEIISE